MTEQPTARVLLPAARLERWVGNFVDRHGPTELDDQDPRGLSGAAEDGSWFRMRLPFSCTWTGAAATADRPAVLRAFASAAEPPPDWGVLLVRKGGFAVARLHAATTVGRKVGQRHVQGRTKAGGQSQQRFARRRDNQAREAFEAAAGHAARLLGESRTPLPVVTGGDRDAVDAVLADPRLRHLRPVGPWLATPDPRGAVLDQAVRDAQTLQAEVHNA